MTAQAHADAGPTELAAQRRASRFAGTLRGRVLQLIVEAGDQGLTAKEAYPLYVDRHGEPAGGYNSIAPRLSELKKRYGLADDTGPVRDKSRAYVATAAGRVEGRVAA
jgi:hypothetical protein